MILFISLIISGPDSKWHCYVCDPKPLANLIQECTNIIDKVQKMKEEREKQKKQQKQSGRKSVRPSVVTPVGKTVTQSGGKPLIKTNMPAVTNILRSSPGSRPNMTGMRPQATVVPTGGPYKSTPPPQPPNNRNIPRAGAAPPVDIIPVNKVENTIYRLLAATQSMQLLTNSLKESFKKTGPVNLPGTKEQRDVAMQLSRAFQSFKKSLNDIDNFAHNRQATKQTTSPQAQKPVPTQLVRNVRGNMPANTKQQRVVVDQHGKRVFVTNPEEATRQVQQLIQAAQKAKQAVTKVNPNIKPKGPIKIKMPFKSPKQSNSGDVICIEDNSDESPPPEKKGKKNDDIKDKTNNVKDTAKGECM